MDRGGGRGHGGPSRQSSSLPRTLHSSLLHTGPQEAGDVFTEEPQPLEASEGEQEEHIPYAPYSTSSARSTSVPYSSAAPPGPPTFEEGSSSGIGGPSPSVVPALDSPPEQPQLPRGRNQTPHLYLPPFRQVVGSTDPALYASSVGGSVPSSSTPLYSFPPPARPPERLPPVRALERGPLPGPSGSSSGQYFDYGQGRNWSVPGPELTPERTPQRSTWSYSLSPDTGSYSRAYGSGYEMPPEPSGTQRWTQLSRQENFAQEEARSTSAPFSAARSTIFEPQFPGPSGSDRPYQEQPHANLPPRSRTVPDLPAYLPPFYDASELQYPTSSPEVTTYQLPQQRLSPDVSVGGLSPASTRLAPPGSPGYDRWYAAPLRQPAQKSPTPVPPVPPAPQPSAAAQGKRTAPASGDDDEDEPRRKVSRKTQIACFFCRGRKLKCDGQLPMCGNCQKRNHPCSYAPYPKRRGPGKAPKGKGKSDPSKRASGSGQASLLPTEASAGTGPQPRASIDTLPPYTTYPSETHLSMPPPPPPVYAPPPRISEHTPGYPQSHPYPAQMGPSTSQGTVPSRAFTMQYPLPGEPGPARPAGMFGRPSFEGGMPAPLAYPHTTASPLAAQRVPGPSRTHSATWVGTSQGASVPARHAHDRHDESSSRELYEFFHEEQQGPPPPPRPPEDEQPPFG